MPDAAEALAKLAEIVEQRGLASLFPLLRACRALAEEASPLDVAVFGQFKSGKSSLLNAVLGRDLLPVGAIPVTAVVTRITAGSDSASVIGLDGSRTGIPLERIADYVSEAGNPDNRRGVAIVDVGTPALEGLPGLRLVDTPGLGSALAHNTQATRDWLPDVAMALVVVSAERPLSQEDLDLLGELVAVAPRIVIVLSKVDLVSAEQRDEVQAFVDRRIRAALGRALPIVPFSTRQDPGGHVARLTAEVLAPVCSRAADERRSALELKLATLARGCEAYLQAALAAAERDEGERAALQKAVFDESVSEPLARDELRLASRRVAGSARPSFENLLLAHRAPLAARIASDLDAEMRVWSGNLARRTARYEAWMFERLNTETGALAATGQPVAERFLAEAEERFRRIVEALRDRLGRNLTGVTLPPLAWQPARPRVAIAPVAIGRTLDTPWGLLSWVIPMSLFGGMFRRHCGSKVAWEVEKNLTRLAGAWADATTAAIADLEERAANWMHDELATLRSELSRTVSDSDLIRTTLRSLPVLAGAQPGDPGPPAQGRA
jgi:GTP-binding protein EngB required for normal cell division